MSFGPPKGLKKLFSKVNWGPSPKNSLLNPWSFQLGGTLGWDPAPSCPPPSGAHPRGGPGGPGASPCDLSTTSFSGFLPLNYVICIFAAYVRKIFAT